jgi:hypothetical protein
MILDIGFVSTSYLHSFLPGGVFILKGIHRSCDIEAGHHVYIGQGRRHWAVAKEEGIDAI